MKPFLLKLLWILSQFGLDPLIFLRSIRGLPVYVRDYVHFRGRSTSTMHFKPCLFDWFEEAGATNSEYFWQDLIVARWINEAKPNKHVDIGSRLDGFVAHVASFRDIEVLDVRPVTTEIPGVIFRQADLTNEQSISSLIDGDGYCDSLSCLHVLEHLGLGRYGDPVDPKGFQKGIKHLSRLLKPSGRLYLSTPMGKERVEFNANWVFSPKTILDQAAHHGLEVERFLVIRYNEGAFEIDLKDIEQTASQLAREPYALVVMQFVKQRNPW